MVCVAWWGGFDDKRTEEIGLVFCEMVVEIEVEDVGYHDASKAHVIFCSPGCRKAHNLKQHIKSSFGLGEASRKCLCGSFVHR